MSFDSRRSDAEAIGIMMKTLLSILKRHRDAPDPYMRHYLFVDKLTMLIDISAAVLKTRTLDLSTEGKSSELLELEARNAKLGDEIQQVFEEDAKALLDWIQQRATRPPEYISNGETSIKN